MQKNRWQQESCQEENRPGRAAGARMSLEILDNCPESRVPSPEFRVPSLAEDFVFVKRSLVSKWSLFSAPSGSGERLVGFMLSSDRDTAGMKGDPRTIGQLPPTGRPLTMGQPVVAPTLASRGKPP